MFEELRSSFPDESAIIAGRSIRPNTLYQRHAASLIGDDRIPKVWRSFVSATTSNEFWEQMKSMLNLEHVGSVGLRYRDKCHIEMDCLLGINTKVDKPSSVKGPHLDNPREIYACLIYMPVEGDDAGGDLIIYRATKDNPTFYGKQMTDDVEPFRRVPYEPNHAIFFQNGPRALHGVSIRRPTDKIRRYVNIEAEYYLPNFEVR